MRPLCSYPARREYWWKLPAQNCNNRYNELGNCTMTNPHPNPTPAQKAEFEKEYLAHCKSVCQANPFCEGFNLPTGHLKAMGCRDDFIHSGATLYLRRGHPQARDPAATTYGPPHPTPRFHTLFGLVRLAPLHLISDLASCLHVVSFLREHQTLFLAFHSRSCSVSLLIVFA